MEDGRGDHYWYDAEGQLTDAYYGAIDPVNNPNNPVRVDYFPYDAMGNRQGWNLLASRGNWLNFNIKDTGVNQYSGWWPYCFIKYDDDIGAPWGTPGQANGVLMQEGWMTAGYNALNQPKMIWTSSTQGGAAFQWFGFDPLGRCVKRWYAQGDGSAPSPATYFVYDGWNLVQEGTSPWTPSHVYFHGARVDEIVASYNSATDTMAYHYYDASGHCTMLTDWQGNIMEQYYYDAFGYPYFYDASGNWLGHSPHGNRFLFTGREWLSELKLYDFRNRLYHPELGRFMQPDPKEFSAGDYNLYRYCHNDPVNKSDPFGLEFTGAGEAREVHDLRDPEGVVVNGLTGPYDVTALVEIVPGANGTSSLKVARFDVKVEDKRVAQTVNGNVRSRNQIDASKRHEDLHEEHARADHDANQNKVLKTGLSLEQAKSLRLQEQRKLIQQFRTNREQDQRDCKRGEGVWRPIIIEENKR